ncbi:hypothetical protein DPMN_181380 [Dreissena polymorpha]|uniref:Uncharacterized protein n=1 Tax=Dreissena polymorpha TaxID=45954 RepID=A0A9D4DEE0_DREPO|nr:hypothetical protein DPMN_181380 [Dreissena polymorpha]
MTSILVTSISANKTTIPRLPKAINRTFDIKQLPGGSLCSIVPYRKPSNRPIPVFECPVTIEEIKPVESIPVKLARLKELLYSFGRSAAFCDDLSEVQNIPNWSIFSAKTIDKDKQNSVSTIAYNPIVMSKPTNYSTIYKTLLLAKEVANALGQSHISVVFDMGLLYKALEIVWIQDDDLKGVIPMDGGMHLLMSIFA